MVYRIILYVKYIYVLLSVFCPCLFLLFKTGASYISQSLAEHQIISLEPASEQH